MAFNFNSAFAQHLPIVVSYPPPRGEVLSNQYLILVAGHIIPVYLAKIGCADDKQRFKAVDDLLHSAEYFDIASFAYFDLKGSVKVSISISDTVKTLKILPSGSVAGIVKHLHSVSFTVNKPNNLTIEINGEWVKSLHLFVDPLDKDIPNPKDTNVIFYGPGIHYVSNVVVGSNKIVYISGGAIIRSIIGKDEKFGIEPSGLKNYEPRFFLKGNHITLRGRGIIDAGDCPVHAGNFIMIKGSDIKIEGVIIRNSCGWTVPVRQSDHVLIDNIKILGYRANSDGVDICNSSNVTVKNSFVRTNDDLIVIKSEKGEGIVNHINVNHCILFNQLANALSIGAELRENVSDVVFSDCEIIHDQSRAWSFKIFQGDSSVVSNVKFQDIRVEEAHQFISLWIGHDISSYNNKAGNIRNVLFKNITANGYPLNIDIVGQGITSRVENVFFQNITTNHLPLSRNNVKNNLYVKNISVTP